MRDSAKRSSFFEELKAGLEEGIRFACGELNLRTTEVPDQPPEMGAGEVLRLRQRCKMSQGVFAQMLNVSTKTVQSWEQGERRPSQAALRLLQLLEAEPTAFTRIVGLRPLLERKSRSLDQLAGGNRSRSRRKGSG
jgi:putative transcriptional regulator